MHHAAMTRLLRRGPHTPAGLQQPLTTTGFLHLPPASAPTSPGTRCADSGRTVSATLSTTGLSRSAAAASSTARSTALSNAQPGPALQLPAQLLPDFLLQVPCWRHWPTGYTEPTPLESSISFSPLCGVSMIFSKPISLYLRSTTWPGADPAGVRGGLKRCPQVCFGLCAELSGSG